MSTMTALAQPGEAIVEVHNESKALFLLCEELEPHEFRTFIQPYSELRHAYEHAVWRCMANQLQLGESAPPMMDYQADKPGKGVGARIPWVFSTVPDTGSPSS